MTTYSLHVELLASDSDVGDNKSNTLDKGKSLIGQDFFAELKSSDLQKVPRLAPILQEIPVVSRAASYTAIGLNVKSNHAKVISTPENPFLVPVMLFHNKHELRLTLFNEKKEQLFQTNISYHLPELYFPICSKINSKWRESINENGVKVFRPPENLESQREKWSFQDLGAKPPLSYICFSKDYQFIIQMGINVALNENAEPISFYGNRIYALQRLAIYFNSNFIPL